MKAPVINTVPKTWQRVAAGIWRHAQSLTLYERPKLFKHGRWNWTFRSLLTQNLKLAREELHRRKVGRAASRTGHTTPIEDVTVGTAIRRYVADGVPDRHRKARPLGTEVSEQRHCKNLLQFMDELTVNDLTLALFDRYHDWRCQQVTKGTGDRTVDMELNTLNNALMWACRVELLHQNPMPANRPQYCRDRDIRHCREFMPANVDELHYVAGLMMSQPRGVALGFQALIEGMTGLRTNEVLQLRTDAAPYEPGWITPDGKSLYVRRSKGQHGVNPYVFIHDALRDTLAALQQWKQTAHPDSPFYLPSAIKSGMPLGKDSLAQTLRRLEPQLPRKITSHGLRAFYVTVRRSQGVTDNQVAWEIGHTSGGRTLAEVYGGVPPHWVNGGGPNLSWQTTQPPAWLEITSQKTQEIYNLSVVA